MNHWLGLINRSMPRCLSIVHQSWKRTPIYSMSTTDQWYYYVMPKYHLLPSINCLVGHYSRSTDRPWDFEELKQNLKASKKRKKSSWQGRVAVGTSVTMGKKLEHDEDEGRYRRSPSSAAECSNLFQLIYLFSKSKVGAEGKTSSSSWEEKDCWLQCISITRCACNTTYYVYKGYKRRLAFGIFRSRLNNDTYTPSVVARTMDETGKQ
jgi:hypothetical protein